MRTALGVCLLILVSALTGCASMRRIHSDVLTVANAPAGTVLQGARYRFERLPSQINNPEAGMAEQQAEAAMAAVGLVRDDANARISVLVGFSGMSYLTDAYGRPWSGPWVPYGHISVGRGIYPQWGISMQMPPTATYRREVSLLMRDLSTGQIVYETRAAHEGPWNDATAIFTALFQAALSQFPTPPTGPRRVTIDLAR